MTLPEVGTIVAVQYERNPTIYSDPALEPRLHVGRVVRHEGSWGFVAALGNYDTAPQETWLECNEEEIWEDRDFQQPVEWVKYPVSAELEALCGEFESLPEELPESEGRVRPIEELRLRFLAAGVEAGWFAECAAAEVFYSDDFPDKAATVARWQRQSLGECDLGADRIVLVWPVEGREESDWAIEFLRQDNGEFHAKSEVFGDEFQARLIEFDGRRMLMGLWGGEEFLSFFGAVFPKK